MGSVTHTMVPLVLKTVKPALGRGIVPAISFPAHRASHVEFLDPILKGMTGILTAATRMVQHASFRSAAKPGHRQRVRHNIDRHAWFERPADHFPAEKIQNDSQVQPAFVGPDSRVAAEDGQPIHQIALVDAKAALHVEE